MSDSFGMGIFFEFELEEFDNEDKTTSILDKCDVLARNSIRE